MHLNPASFQGTLDRFLSEWRQQRVQSMTLEEYSSIGIQNTFCYQVEWGTEAVGSISGVSLVKFGIWNQKKKKEYKRASIHQADGYAWVGKYGNSKSSAFQAIKSLVVEIIQHATQGQFEKIDDIDYHSIAKWKIAFLYSNNRILPIYSREALILIAYGLGVKIQTNIPTYELHKLILQHKPANESIDKFAFGLWHKFAEEPSSRNYYVVGSKYKHPNSLNYNSIYPSLLSKSVVAIGHLWGHDLSPFFKKPSEIDRYLEGVKAEIDNYSSTKRALKTFLDVKEGDLIAVKDIGSFSRLTIVAYAEVVSRNGSIYSLDDELGHVLHVNFIEYDLEIETGLNYATTIQRVDRIKKPDDFYKIFGTYALISIPAEPHAGSAVDSKNTSNQTRKGVPETTVNLIHNRIQNAFKDYLVTGFPGETITLEYKNRVDLAKENDSEVIFYEVKPYNSVYQCIREGLGQLLLYNYLFGANEKRSVKLKVVGIKEPDSKEAEFINYMKDKIKPNVSFDYEYFAYLDEIKDSTVITI